MVALELTTARVARAVHLQAPGSDIAETLEKGSLFSDLLSEHWRQQLLLYCIVSFWEGKDDVRTPRLTLKSDGRF